MSKRRFVWGGLSVALILLAGISWQLLNADPFRTGHPLRADTRATGPVALLDGEFDIDPLSPGWILRTFWGTDPTDYTFDPSDGRMTLRCATDDSASILARDTAIDLADYPTLHWSWKVDRPIDSKIDEATRDGDDHPARFFLRFENADGQTAAAEIIWSNDRFEPGDTKIIDGFHHLVANGRDENLGIWIAQRVDLLALYRHVVGDSGAVAPILTVLGFFCDSDDTGGSTEAWFRDVEFLPRATP